MYALQSINLSSFDTRNVTTMEKMFIGTNTIQTLDLSSFNTAKVNNFKNMFDDMTALQTIYVSDDFVTSACTSNPQLFSGDVSLVGGAGTTFNSSQNKLNYAHIDGGTSNPGYFTRK
jgi:surface protein